MHVTLKNNVLTDPPIQLISVDTILVSDEHDNPIFIAIQQNDNNVMAISANDPKFEQILSELPISKRKVKIVREASIT